MEIIYTQCSLSKILFNLGLANSRNEAKRLIEQGAVEIFDPNGNVYKPYTDTCVLELR